MNRKLCYKILSFIFVLLLFVPCLGIFREKRNVELIAEMENRAIASKPTSAIFSGKFFHEFEEWYNDRLLGRKDLIRLWSSINGKLFNTLISKEVAIGKDGFLFDPFYLNSELIDEDKKIDTLTKVKKLCEDNNAKFTVFIAPHSEWLFPELLPSKYVSVNLEKLEKEIAKVFDENRIDHCFIGKSILDFPLEERKSMYYKGDYHWNKKGAHYGAKALLKHLKLGDVINQEVEYKPEKSYADIYTRKIGWNAIVSDVEVPWSNHFTNDFTVINNIGSDVYSGEVKGAAQKGEIVYINNRSDKNVSILVLGDSFFIDMKEYLLQDVKTIIYSHNSGISSPKKYIDVETMIEKYKPDIVVYEKMGAFFYGYGYDVVFGNMKM